MIAANDSLGKKSRARQAGWLNLAREEIKGDHGIAKTSHVWKAYDVLVELHKAFTYNKMLKQGACADVAVA